MFNNFKTIFYLFLYLNIQQGVVKAEWTDWEQAYKDGRIDYKEMSNNGFSLTNLYECEGAPQKVKNFYLNNINSDGEKMITVEEFNLVKPIDNDTTYTIIVDNLNNGDWQDDIFDTEGNFCQMIAYLAQGFWDKLRKDAGIPTDDPCFVEAGTYSVEDFRKGVKQGRDIFFYLLYGHLRVTVTLSDKDDTEFVCFVVQGNGNKKK